MLMDSAAARSRYEELKKQTQDELKQTLDQLLEGDDKVDSYFWFHTASGWLSG